MKSGKISPVLFVVLGIAVGLLVFFLLIANPFGWKIPFPTLTKSPTNSTQNKIPKGAAAAPTPYLFLPKGKQTYNAQGGSAKSTVTTITFDPLDPAKGATQEITAKVNSQETVASVSLTVNTDNNSTTYPMTLIKNGSPETVWIAQFKSTDTYEKIYNISFEIITSLGNKTTQPMLIR